MIPGKWIYLLENSQHGGRTKDKEIRKKMISQRNYGALLPPRRAGLFELMLFFITAK